MPIAGISTRRISSVAYATDDMLSEEKTASAVGRPSRSCSRRDVASGRPRRSRLIAYPVPRSTSRAITITLGSAEGRSAGRRVRVPSGNADRRQGCVKRASLRSVDHAHRGRLRIYVGYAPGVGKTFAMLDEAGRRKDRGTDVVIAVVDTHDRPPVDALTRELELAGPGGVEMDVEAVLPPRPQGARVDD